MKKTCAFAAVALPLAIMGCNRPPEPVAVAVPVVSGPEQACAARAAETAGLDPAAVSAMPVSATKTGDTIYAVDAGGVSYTCVVGLDGTVSEFAPG